MHEWRFAIETDLHAQLAAIKVKRISLMVPWLPFLASDLILGEEGRVEGLHFRGITPFLSLSSRLLQYDLMNIKTIYTTVACE
jgi:hypothetical protein